MDGGGRLKHKCCLNCGLNCTTIGAGTGPPTLQIASTQTWVAVRCEQLTRGPNTACCWTTTNLPGYDPPGCPGAGYDQFSHSEFTTIQTVTRTVTGTLYKDAANDRYVANRPGVIAASDRSVEVVWEVTIAGNGTKQVLRPEEQFFDRIGGTIDDRLCFGCWGPEQCSTSYTDGGTIYPGVFLDCVVTSETNCGGQLPGSPTFARLNIGNGVPGSTAGQFPTRVLLPQVPNGTVFDPTDMPWPPIIASCPLPELVNGVPWQSPINESGNPPDPCPDSSMAVCPGCGQTLPNLGGTCWACRTECVPFFDVYDEFNQNFQGRSWPSPTGYGTTWVPEKGVLGSYRLLGHSQELEPGWLSGSDHGSYQWTSVGICIICEDGQVDVSCPLPDNTDPSWCYWELNGDKGAFKMVASGNLTITE